MSREIYDIACPNCGADMEIMKDGEHYIPGHCPECDHLPSEEEINKTLHLYDPGCFVIIVDPGDEVICDLCNAEIGEEEGGAFCGSYAICEVCKEKMLASGSDDLQVYPKNFKQVVLQNRMSWS